MKAFEKISHEFPDLRLILAGYEFDSCERLLSLRSKWLSHRIEYAGFLTGTEKMKILSGAKVFVLPSRHESSPISILEAAAMGKPVIVSNIPELAFVTKNNFGLSFASGSPDDLAERLRFLLNEKGKRQEMGHYGRLFAGQFLWDDIALRFESVLQESYNDKRS